MRSPVPFKIEDRGVSGVARPLDTLWQVVHAGTVYDRLKAGLTELGPEWAPFAELAAADLFARVVVSESSIDGVDVPSAGAGPAQLAAAFMAFARLSTDVLNACADAMAQASLSDADRKLLPPDMLSEQEQDFTPPSARTNETA